MQIRKRAGLVVAGIFGLPWAVLSVFAFIADLPNIRNANWSGATAQYAGAAMLGVIGFGILGVVIIQWSRQADMDRCRAANPDKQWLWRRDWTAGRADDFGHRKMQLLWFFASLWIVLSLPLIFLVIEDAANSDRQALFLLIFPAASLGWIYLAQRASKHWQKFGQTSFVMASVPCLVQDGVIGAIEFEKPFQSAAKFDLELSCSQRVKRKGADGKIQIRNEEIWNDEKDARLDANGKVPVEFSLPANARITDLQTSGKEITWRLDVEALVNGVAFKASFDVPVFK